ncbi:MAG: nitrilase-related carbon-nitrogen hydrolase [Planctomycetota bacterium]|nr:nitrilase-related carbon-nitrogen hydrolase [Planctomycetota bacterium]
MTASPSSGSVHAGPRAHLVQIASTWEDPAANREKLLDLLDTIDPAPREGDLILLPEMFDTGFSMNLAATADKGNATLHALAEIAQEHRVTVQGGRTVHDCHCDRGSNTMSVVAHDAALGSRLLCEYRKVHLFTLTGEDRAIAPGTRIETYDWEFPDSGAEGGAGRDRLKVCPIICYDLRFPELFRKGLLQGAEVFAVGACWPAKRIHHWRALLIARAIENQAFVLGVTRTGSEPGVTYSGGTIAIDPTGQVLGELGPDEGVLSVEIDPRTLRAWRGAFPAWKEHRLLS